MPRMGKPIDPKAAASLAEIAAMIDRHRAEIEPLEVTRNRIMRAQRKRGVPVRVIAEAAGISGARVAQLTAD